MEAIVIGTGSIGKRYIQAIKNNEKKVPIYLYDKDKSNMEKTDKFLDKLSLDKEFEKINSYNSAIEKINKKSIVIISTTARNRYKIVLDVLKKEPKNLIIEKPVTQTIYEYRRILEESEKVKTKCNVNYYLRCQPFTNEIEKEIDKSSKINMDVRLPGNGIACNGIHFIDMFMYITERQEYYLGDYKMDNIYEQKREGYWDVSGWIEVVSSNGDKCRIYNGKEYSEQIVAVNSKKGTVTLYEDRDKASIFTREREEIRNIDSLYASEYLVSELKKCIKKDNASKSCLTSITEALKSHRILFEFLRSAGCSGINIT